MSRVETIGDATLYLGDCREILPTLASESINCCITSPPYFGLRDYGHSQQIGQESSPAEFVDELVSVFREVRRVIRSDGTLWLNLGDTYLKDGNLAGVPWLAALALRADGWILRSSIIWHKTKVMPEPVKDRPTRDHEHLFLLAKSRRYFYDFEAIKEPWIDSNPHDLKRAREKHPGYDGKLANPEGWSGGGMTGAPVGDPDAGRNKRTVWSISPSNFKGAHFATFPRALVEPCLLAGCPAGGVVLDPFAGSGTVAAVAAEHGRKSVMCELNPDYMEIQRKRVAAASAQQRLFA